MNLIYSNFDQKFALCSRCAVLCYDHHIFSTEIVIINKIYFFLRCHFGAMTFSIYKFSYIEIFTDSFLELSSYILGTSREIFPLGYARGGASSFDNEMRPYRNISRAAIIIQMRIELRRKEKRISWFFFFFPLNISVLGNDGSRKLKRLFNFVCFFLCIT